MVDAGLDVVIHQPTRLRVMAALHRNRRMTHAALCAELGLTDGNMAGHARRLMDAGYLDQVRAFEGRSFRAVYRITKEGAEAFEAYLDALEGFLHGARGPTDHP